MKWWQSAALGIGMVLGLVLCAPSNESSVDSVEPSAESTFVALASAPAGSVEKSLFTSEPIKSQPKPVAVAPKTDKKSDPVQRPKVARIAGTPDADEYQKFGRARTALLSAARKGQPDLEGTLFYSPAIVTDGKQAYIISEARKSYGAKPVWAVAHLTFEDGVWTATSVEVSDEPITGELARTVASQTGAEEYGAEIATAIAEEYEAVVSDADKVVAENVGDDADSWERKYAAINDAYADRMESRSKVIASSSTVKDREYSVGWSYKPRVAENGSYYGEISTRTYLPKTIYVSGYYRKNGTYVRSHFRSRR